MYSPLVVTPAGDGKAPMRALLAARGLAPSHPRCRSDCGPARNRLRFPG